MDKITINTTIREVVENNPELLEVLAEHVQGACFGCPMAQVETLGEAAAAHGVDAEELVKKLNEQLEKTNNQ